MQTATKFDSTAVASALFFLRRYIGRSQLLALQEALRGEERQFFADMLTALVHRIEVMPATYETDGGGDNAICFLHYFKGGMDWHITEKDCDEDNAGQHQAFGLANIGFGAELGYISITELIQHGVELDLYWTPKPLAQCRKG